MNCHQVLSAVTNQDFGFMADSDANSREQAVARWRTWYDQQDDNG